MSSTLENVIFKVNHITTDEGQAEGFREIQDWFKDPNILVALSDCMTLSVDPQLRRYAVLLARRRILKLKHWNKIPPDVRQCMKNAVLEAYIIDKQKTIKKGFTELAAAIAKHDLFDGKRPELMNILNSFIHSTNVTDIEPYIGKSAPELLPVLFECLQETCILLQQGHEVPPSLVRTFSVVEWFCAHLDIAPYLPTLMACLTAFFTIDNENAVMVKECALEAIGSIAAAAAQSDFVPFFNPVVEHLKGFISDKQTEATRPLQAQTIDALTIIARTAGPETFIPLAHECVKYGLHLMQDNGDPYMRRACYGLFSSLSVVMKSEMVPYLSTITEHVLESLRSTEGISISTRVRDTNTGFTLFDDGEEEENDNDTSSEQFENLERIVSEDYDITDYCVQNAYKEEKEGALHALREMCEEIGVQFIPYIEVCANEMEKLVEHLSGDVGRAALGTLAQFCVTLNRIFLETGNLECKVALDTTLGVLFPKLFSLAREETEHSVVLDCLWALMVVVGKVKNNAINAGYLESIYSLLKDVFKNKLACQDEGMDDEEDKAECDKLLWCACKLITYLIKVVPWQLFGPYLASLIPFLLSKSKKTCTVSEKSFSIGTLADIVNLMEPGTVRPFISDLQPVFLSGMEDETAEVRSHAVYGLGVLVENAGKMVFDQFPAFIQALSNMMATEEDPRAKDNICAALARLLKMNCKDVPLNNVFLVFLQYLPLKEDLEENFTVYECLIYLQVIRREQFSKSIPQVLKICSEAVASEKLDEQTLAVVVILLNNIYDEFPSDFESILKSLPQANAEALLKARSVA